MRSKTMLWALVLLALAPCAAAQMIYKCVGKGGAVSYQSEPCPSNAKTGAVREFQSYRAPGPAPVVHRTTTTTHHRIVNSDGAKVVSIAQGTGDRCAAAKRQRAEWERTVKLSRTIDDIRRWNEFVFNACK